MTKDQYIANLRAELGVQIDWAAEISDEYLDGDDETRKAFSEDRERAQSLIRIHLDELCDP